MTFLKLFTTLSLLLSFISAVFAEESAVYIEGVDYWKVQTKLVDVNNELDNLNKIADIEFFYWYGCEPCRQIEEALTNFQASNPNLTIKRTPLIAHLNWREQAYIQPVIQQLVAAQVNVPPQETIYQACLSDCSVFNSYESTLDWLKQTLKLEQFPRVNELAVWQAEKDYRKRAETFSISQVPTIIIRENYAVDANTAKSSQRLMNIVSFLLTQ
ncbi:hypothetical protein [Aliikangiella sp. IMCC44359]|uniref:hypothetical protein n=1 Tax=Aliikangiella sp. IMCC44359 TaxID=3459125 RepID=UPI00403AC537